MTTTRSRMTRLLPLIWLVFTALATGNERILSFDSRIEVRRDGVIEVTETLRVQAEGNQIQRGIFRDFPELYQGRWGLKERRSFEVLEVLRDGQAEPHVIEKHKAGARVRIGNAAVMLGRGEHTYLLRYRSDRQLLFFDDHDELYWNVTGNEWGFPIESSRAEVVLPEGVEVRSIEGYVGPAGSKEAALKADPEPGANSASIQAGRPLPPGEGFTMVATWAPRVLDAAAYQRDSTRLLRDNPLLLGALGLLAGMLVWHVMAWLAVGRDPAPGLVIPQFGPPDGWSPAGVRMLKQMRFDNTCFSAAVLGLAAGKHLSIGGTEKKPTLVRSAAAPAGALEAEEKALFNALLGSRSSLELVQANHKAVAGARAALQKSLRTRLEKTHFSRNARHWLPGFFLTLLAVGLLLANAPEPAPAMFMILWLSIWTIGTGALVSAVVSQARAGAWLAAVPLGLFSLPFVAGWFGGVFFLYSTAGVVASAAFVFGALVNCLFYHWIKAPTHLGRRILDHIDGFQHYLSVAEEDRLSGFTGPEKTPELFEKFLPYAHALGVEQRWSEKFEEVLRLAGTAQADGRGGYRPSFYTGSHAGFTGPMAAAALGGALGSALTTASSSPSSSGRGGGGSSGGGGGGGGGGGW
jgi:uncharacterized membrane protein YgcG